VLSYKYLFIVPVTFSFLITACLTVAASLSGRREEEVRT
jgi:starvation-inducible outer membrane lipoprotein